MPSIRPSAKMFYFFSKNSLPSAPFPTLGKVWIFFKKKSLPSALWPALGKVWIFLKKKFFAECPLAGTRQSLNFFKKKLFAEYRGHYTRQNWENGFPSTHFSNFAECHHHCTQQSDWKQPFLFIFYIQSKQLEDIYNKHHKLVSHYRCINMQYN